MGKILRHFSKNIQMAHRHIGSTNQKHKEIQPHTHYDGCNKKKRQMTSVGEGVEKSEAAYTGERKVK